MSNKRARFKDAIPVAIGLLALIVFSASLRNEFVNWDDYMYVVDNALIKQLDLESLREIFRPSGEFVDESANWAPLTLVSYALDHALWGRRPLGYHLTNLLFHALCCVLLYTLLQRILGRGDPEFSRIPAALAATLFAIHPVQVESVAWISERKNLIGMALFLGAFLAWLRATRLSFLPGTYFLSLVLFTGSLLAKAHAVVLPPLLLLFEWVERPHWRESARTSQSRMAFLIPFLAIALWVGAITLQAQDVKEQTRLTGDLLGAFATAPVLVLGYLADLIFPMNQSAILSPTVYRAPWDLIPAVAYFLLAGWTFVALSRRRSCPHVAFFSLWFLLALAPVLNLVPLPVLAADRYQYWGAPGLFALAGLGASALWSRLDSSRRRMTSVLPWFIAGFLVILTVLRISIWREPLTLWTDAVRKSPNEVRVRNNLSYALFEAGRIEEAAREARVAIGLDPLDAKARSSLGAALLSLGKRGEAEAQLRQALRLDPKIARARLNLATVLLRLGKTREAEREYRAFLQANPLSATAHTNFSIALYQSGRFEEAEREAREAVRLDPLDAKARSHLGELLLTLRKTEEAERAIREALGLDPDDAIARNNLAMVFLGRGRVQEAEKELKAALHSDPQNTRVLHNLARVSRKLGKYEEAKRLLEELVRRDGQDASARSDLSLILMKLGNFEEAELQSKEALRLDPAKPAPAYNLACLSVRRGNPEAAFGWLDQLAGLGYRDTGQLERDPCFSSIRSDPRFALRLERMKTGVR